VAPVAVEKPGHRAQAAAPLLGAYAPCAQGVQAAAPARGAAAPAAQGVQAAEPGAAALPGAQGAQLPAAPGALPAGQGVHCEAAVEPWGLTAPLGQGWQVVGEVAMGVEEKVLTGQRLQAGAPGADQLPAAQGRQEVKLVLPVEAP
jgi:hypothetical protein